MWCLKRLMARKPLMHNYIYFETLEVGYDFRPGGHRYFFRKVRDMMG